ncbi:MAG: hypothetical protein GC181_11080 [Bacteroidetes bacterium]|nr:hypothetical protein [Bacteroidota bacterium]
MDELSITILRLLIFPETFDSIVEECEIESSKHIISDVLKKLIHDELVSPGFNDEKGNFKRSLGYDSDAMGAYIYQITAKGIRRLENRT